MYGDRVGDGPDARIGQTQISPLLTDWRRVPGRYVDPRLGRGQEVDRGLLILPDPAIPVGDGTPWR